MERQKVTAPANVVPGTKVRVLRTFYTVHGPYAQPGDVLTILRTAPQAFMWKTVKGNTVQTTLSVQSLIEEGAIEIVEN